MEKVKRKRFKREDELDVHFPDRSLEINGHVVVMSPMKVRDADKFLSKYAQLRELARIQATEGETLRGIIPATFAALILPMLPCCIQGIDVGDIPLDRLQDVLQVWISQNLNDEILKNWDALADQVNERLGRVSDFTALSPSREASVS